MTGQHFHDTTLGIRTHELVDATMMNMYCCYRSVNIDMIFFLKKKQQGTLWTTAEQNLAINAFWGIFFVVLVFSECLGFLVYGRKLVRLMPLQGKRKGHHHHNTSHHVTPHYFCYNKYWNLLLRFLFPQITLLTSLQAIFLMVITLSISRLWRDILHERICYASCCYCGQDCTGGGDCANLVTVCEIEDNISISGVRGGRSI